MIMKEGTLPRVMTRGVIWSMARALQHALVESIVRKDYESCQGGAIAGALIPVRMHACGGSARSANRSVALAICKPLFSAGATSTCLQFSRGTGESCLDHASD